jgi:hypothetical protein
VRRRPFPLFHLYDVPLTRKSSSLKCLSSQWGGSYNLAGVAYACAVAPGGEVTRQGTSLFFSSSVVSLADPFFLSSPRTDNTLEPTKQWWIMVPVSDYEGNSDSSNHMLLAAQAHSVSTREKAQRKAASKAKFHKHHRRSPAPEPIQAEDIEFSSPNHSRFELVSRPKKSSSSSKSKKHKSSAAAQKKKKQQQQQQQQKKAKVAAAAKKAAALKKKKNSSKSKTGGGKKGGGVKNIIGSGLNVKLNVAKAQRYFIIPVR